jgi:predicted double-glycine peptidase
MNLWLAALVALLCALMGVALGWGFSPLRSPYWTIGYFIPLVLVFAYALALHYPALVFMPPFSWMMMGLRKFAVLGFIATLVLTTPLSRVPQKRNRIMISVLMAFLVFYAGIWPFIAPMVNRGRLSHLQTEIDNHGICRQTTDYTCGPAAAVTALRKLGLPAEEGQIAILSCTSSMKGTPEDMLADGLNRQYAAQGLSARCRVFRDMAELKEAGLTLAIVKFDLTEDHWVTVLEVTDSQVVVGDPIGGLERMTYEEFTEKWRFIGIVIQRKSGAALNRKIAHGRKARSMHARRSTANPDRSGRMNRAVGARGYCHGNLGVAPG